MANASQTYCDMMSDSESDGRNPSYLRDRSESFSNMPSSLLDFSALGSYIAGELVGSNFSSVFFVPFVVFYKEFATFNVPCYNELPNLTPLFETILTLWGAF